jgi:hypothetical protein
MPQPTRPKIYHIVHVDCLASIVADGGLDCDAVMQGRQMRRWRPHRPDCYAPIQPKLKLCGA